MAKAAARGAASRVDKLLMLLVLLPLLTVPARAQSPLLTTCQALMQWIDGDSTFPRPGTTFCPVQDAFEKFAKDTGFSTWQDLFSAARAAPAAWRPYLGRLMQYHRSPAYVTGASVPKGDSTIETALVASLGQAGSPGDAQMAVLQLQGRGKGKGGFTIAKAKGKQAGQQVKAKVQQPDLLKTAGAVVHGVDRVLMPPDTYYTLRGALRGVKELRQMGKMMRKMYQNEIQDPSTWATVVAPMDAAWKALKYTKPYPAWVGNITAKEVQKDKGLQRAIMQYSFVKLPAGDFNQTLDHDRMLQIWRLAAAQNIVSLPTGLSVNGEQQLSYYKYDPGTDQIFVIGHRNLNAQTAGADARAYMTGGALQKRTVYAGCSTILFTDSFVPLPRRTGLAAYDGIAATMP